MVDSIHVEQYGGHESLLEEGPLMAAAVIADVLSLDRRHSPGTS